MSRRSASAVRYGAKKNPNPRVVDSEAIAPAWVRDAIPDSSSALGKNVSLVPGAYPSLTPART